MSNQQGGSLASAVAAKLIELEHDTDSMTLEDVYKRHRAHGWDVLEQRNSDVGDFTTAKQDWTEKGLRSFLALLELYDFLIPEYEVQRGGAS